MNPDYLEFEQPIAELEIKINELRQVGAGDKINISEEVAKLEEKSRRLTEKIFSSLTPWQISLLARHPLRPYTEDYIQHIFTDFDELHGDRFFGDDPALIGGVARLDDIPVMVIGHQKGRSTQEKVRRNFGMPKPEGYRKARRLMILAERYKMPVLTFIDTPGAYPGIDSEARGINEAIAENLALMSRLRTPLIATVTGEGNSGGAIAIGVCDHLNMLQYSTYFVISPEGCATILWKSSDYKAQAAEAMGVTSERLQELGIVDQVIEEPLGGAHRDIAGMASRIKESLLEQIRHFQSMDTDSMLERRYERLMSHGDNAHAIRTQSQKGGAQKEKGGGQKEKEKTGTQKEKVQSRKGETKAQSEEEQKGEAGQEEARQPDTPQEKST